MRWFNKGRKSQKTVDFNGAIAASAMSELDAATVLAEANRREIEEQPLFLITYAAFLLWLTGVSLANIITIDEYEQALNAVSEAYSKQNWWDEKTFFEIWDSMYKIMPQAFVPNSDGLIYPVAELIESANQAGFPLSHSKDLEFGMHVVFTINNYLKDVKILAYEFKKRN